MLGTYEYSDFPMDTETYGVKPGEHIPGQVVYRYLCDYAIKTGVYGRIRFGAKVVSASRIDEGWELRLESGDLLATKRLVVATGLTSEPFVPTFPGAELFSKTGLLAHSRDFKKHANRLFHDCGSVTVLGGSKSAWDIAYACATRNVPVNLVIRESGQGPTWMAPPYVTPFKAWLEKLVHKRFLTWMSPCVWGDEDGFTSIRSFLHNTWVGRKVVDAFWWVLGTDAKGLMGYSSHPETKKLEPWHSAFWTGSGLGIVNYEGDFLELVREGKIRVHVADVEVLGDKSVRLSDGTSVETDALICATGWKAIPPLNFLPEGIDRELGLPHNASLKTHTQDLKAVDEEILRRFPRLTNQPETRIPGGDTTADAVTQPFCLYRFIAPPSAMLDFDPTIAFAGMLTTITTSTIAEAQALWISAYFDKRLNRSPCSVEQAEREALLHSRFGRWRYACGYGARFPDFVFDAVPYLDMLFKDLGMQTRRKKGLMAEVFESYGPEDYAYVVEDWAEKEGYGV